MLGTQTGTRLKILEPLCIGSISLGTGWITGSEVHEMKGTEIPVPAGWSGKIAFQLKMRRSGYGNRAGCYSCSLRVEVNDGS